MATRITNLPLETLINITSLLGKTCNGAASFAKAMFVNRLFLEAANKIDNLADFKSRNTNIQAQHECYQQKKGLAYNCARAGNAGAQYLLAKVIMATCTQLMELGIPKENINRSRDYNKKLEKC